MATSFETVKEDLISFIDKEGAVISSELSRYLEYKHQILPKTTYYILKEFVPKSDIKYISPRNRANPVVRGLYQLRRYDPNFEGLNPDKLHIYHSANISENRLLEDTQIKEKISAILTLSKVREEMGRCLEDVVYAYFKEELDLDVIVRYSPAVVTNANFHDIDCFIKDSTLIVLEPPIDHQNIPLKSSKLEPPINIDCKNQYDQVRPESYNRFILRAALVKSKSLVSITTTTDINIIKPSLVKLAQGMGINAISITPCPIGYLKRLKAGKMEFEETSILVGHLYYSKDYYQKYKRELELLQKNKRALIGNNGKRKLFKFFKKILGC
jgi:hypothetical protein